jgi:hypothetical protein
LERVIASFILVTLAEIMPVHHSFEGDYNMNKSESGQVLIASACLLLLIAVGIIVVMSGVGHNPLVHNAVQNCVQVVYNNGIKELVCK